MRQAVRHRKYRPCYPTAVLETPLQSKVLPLSQEQSRKSVLGGNGKKEDFLETQPRLCQMCAACEARESRNWRRDFTLPGGRTLGFQTEDDLISV